MNKFINFLNRDIMCFITTEKRIEKKIADRDIPCWKALVHAFDEVYESPVMADQAWMLHQDSVQTARRRIMHGNEVVWEPISELTVIDNHLGWSAIEEGFHTYSTPPFFSVTYGFGRRPDKYVVLEFYIPAGTEYAYSAKNGEYVSVKLGYRKEKQAAHAA